jgi:hypothetical protein
MVASSVRLRMPYWPGSEVQGQPEMRIPLGGGLSAEAISGRLPVSPGEPGSLEQLSTCGEVKPTRCPRVPTSAATSSASSTPQARRVAVVLEG